ncbi:hypothetical protein KC331_g14466 [Hortaea werneckii]|nr:hypothetical protein KC331_g14466 [Hortaea werneckii]
MRIALAAVGLAAAAHRAGAEADPELEGPAVVDTDTQQSTQSLRRHEGYTSPWWQRAWDAGAQLIKRTPEPQDGPVVTVTETVSEEQCSNVQVFTSTINPETTATVTTTKETTFTQYVPQLTTGDADDEKTIVITPSDYGVDLPPVTTTVTRYPSDHSWDHSWTAGSWNSEWEGNTATYTETISEIEMPVTSTVYSGAENAPTSGTSAGPSQGTTELSPAGPVIVTKTVTISNVEIPWTTTKTASQEVVTSTFTTTADGSVVTSTFTTTAAGSNGGQEVVTTTFTTTPDGSNGGQEVVTTTFTTTADGSNGGAIQPTTITEGNAPQTTVATQPGESAGDGEYEVPDDERHAAVHLPPHNGDFDLPGTSPNGRRDTIYNYFRIRGCHSN